MNEGTWSIVKGTHLDVFYEGINSASEHFGFSKSRKMGNTQ